MTAPLVDLGDDPDGDMDEQEAIALAWSLHNHHYSARCGPGCPYRAAQTGAGDAADDYTACGKGIELQPVWREPGADGYWPVSVTVYCDRPPDHADELHSAVVVWDSVGRIAQGPTDQIEAGDE